MALTNTQERYGRVAQVFHWTTALMILTLIPTGVLMVQLPLSTEAQVATKVWLYSFHKTLGVALLAVAIARIIWAMANPKPEPLHPERRLETFAAETVHWLLYAGIILAPITGLVHHFATTGFAPIWWPFAQTVSFIPVDESLANIFKYLHFAAAVMIGVSVVAHVAGALKHAFVDQDKTVRRMVCGPDEVIVTPGKEAQFGSSSAATAVVVILLAAGGGYGYATQTAYDAPTVAFASADEANTTDAAHGNAPAWTVDMDNSTLGVTAVQLGSSISGAFENWQADIRFDPDALDQSRVTAQIDTGTLTIGSVSSQATGNDFLQAADFPLATFTADEFIATSDAGNYEAVGELTIRDVTMPFTLPFSLQIDGDTAAMSSETALNRMDFGVGAASYGNEQSVAFEVGIAIIIQATRGSEAAPTG